MVFFFFYKNELWAESKDFVLSTQVVKCFQDYQIPFCL